MSHIRPYRASTEGFTLVEVLVVMGISIMALIALTNLALTFNLIYGFEEAFIATAGSAGRAMNTFEEHVLPASQVLSSHDFSGTTYSSGETTLVLELPAIDNAGNIVVGAKDYVVFYTSSATLYRLLETDIRSARKPGLKILSTALDWISFTYDNPDKPNVTSVIVNLQTKMNYKQLVTQSQLREQLYLRNHTSP